MLEAYEGYFENGQFFPLNISANIKNRRRVIITVLNDEITDDNNEEETAQAAAWREFFEAINDCDEDVPETFERVNFNREVLI